jgi:vancomycin permeability regulator SanA
MVDDRASQHPRARAPAPGARRLRRWLLKAALVLVSLPILAVGASNAVAAIAARGRATTALSAVRSRQVAIVPGARVFQGRPLAILRDRLEAARALYEQGRVRAILVSGNETAAAPEVSVMRAWLRARGVPAADIWTDEGGTRTRETMLHASGVHGVTDAVVCTQTLHMPRTLYLARAAGIDAEGIALPTTLSEHPRFVAIEALKTTLAVVESVVRGGPDAVAGTDGARATIAAR